MVELFGGKSKEKIPISYKTGSFLVRGTGLEPVTPCTSNYSPIANIRYCAALCGI